MLLISCAQVGVGSGDPGCIRTSLLEDLDWAYLIETAQRHAVLPLLYQGLVTTCPERVPTAALVQLQDRFQDNARRNFVLSGELLRCLDVLGAHGIPAVPYRGPVLAASLYGDLALRQFVDLDVLLHKKDVLRARDLLMSLGYRPEFKLNSAQEAAYLRAQSEHKVMRDEGAVIVELHWQIAERYFSFPLDPASLSGRLEPISLAGREVWTFSPEDLLLILCVHGTKHLWERLAWMCDVGKLISTSEALDWHWVVEQAKALRSERMLLLGLCLAEELLGSSLPDAIRQKMRGDPSVASLAAQVRAWLWCDATERPGNLDRCRFHLRARERIGDRLRYAWRLAVTTTPGDWAAVRLPSPLFPLYYLLRPVRLLGEYGPELVRRLT